MIQHGEQHPKTINDGSTDTSSEVVGQSLFREAMSSYSAAVHIVTTDGPGGKTGVTATAVCSVTDAPPTLLVCLNRRGQSASLLATNGIFCVNTLAYDDEIISDIFAGRTGAGPLERFNVGNWQTLKTGAPVLTSAIAVCDCRVSEVKAVGTHDVIFGIVQAISFKAGGPALIYRGRNYLAL